MKDNWGNKLIHSFFRCPQTPMGTTTYVYKLNGQLTDVARLANPWLRLLLLASVLYVRYALFLHSDSMFLSISFSFFVQSGRFFFSHYMIHRCTTSLTTLFQTLFHWRRTGVFHALKFIMNTIFHFSYIKALFDMALMTLVLVIMRAVGAGEV